jgi:drug/metabolite transporter (DMT)-like permease
MFKWLCILLVGLTFESAGVVMLKKGMTEIGSVNAFDLATGLKVARAGITNAKILGGVFCEAVFFGTLLFLMGHSNISFLWPMTGLSFVFATIAARIFLHEEVANIRWAGVILIVFGAGLISYSEKLAENRTKNPAQTTLSGALRSGN